MVVRDLTVGQVVCSKTGRDRGRYFVIIDKQGDVVFVADGDMRRVEAPKKKNVKHLQATNHHVELDIIKASNPKKGLSNQDIKEALAKLGFGVMESGPERRR